MVSMVYVARVIHKTGFCNVCCAAPKCSGEGVKDDTFGIERCQDTSTEKVYTWSLLIIQLKIYLLHTAQI